MSLNIDDEKSSESNKNETEMDLELINKLSKMTNDEIGQMLSVFILDDETNQFISCLKAIKLLELKSNEKEKKAKTNKKTKISLNYILNEKVYGSTQSPLILTAVEKDNIEIVETLLSNENNYKVNSFCFFYFFVWHSLFQLCKDTRLYQKKKKIVQC